MQSALQLIQNYRSVIQTWKENVEKLLVENQEKQRILYECCQLCVPTSHAASSSSSWWNVLWLKQEVEMRKICAAQPFMAENGQLPPVHKDTVRKQQLSAGCRLPPGRLNGWSGWERRLLIQTIRQSRMTAILKQELSKIKDNSNNQTNGEAMSVDQYTSAVQSCVSRIHALPLHQLVELPKDFNWKQIVQKYFPHRSVEDCQIEWYGRTDPRINHSDWQSEEDIRLLNAIAIYGANDWMQVAAYMDTNRTPLQCLTRFQTVHNNHMIQSKWSAADDARLADAVARYGERNWLQISSLFRHHPEQQCLHRWQKCVNPLIRSGRWSAMEDIRLRLAVRAYGTRAWSKIQQHVQGRTDVKCRERWVNVLSPQLTKDAWTGEEDEKLMECTQQLGEGNWTKIAQHMHPRTDNQCWRRWKYLHDLQQGTGIMRETMDNEQAEQTDGAGSIPLPADSLADVPPIAAPPDPTSLSAHPTAQSKRKKQQTDSSAKRARGSKT